jgi:integrase
LPPSAHVWRRGRQFGVWDPPAWRWHAESGAGDEVIMSIAGHVSRAMLSRYSHVRMEAKRRALDEIAARQCAADKKRKDEAEQREQAATFSQSPVVQ